MIRADGGMKPINRKDTTEVWKWKLCDFNWTLLLLALAVGA